MAKPVGAVKIRRVDTPRERFDSAITRLRIEKGVSQESASEAIGWDAYYLRNIEQDKENFSFDVMYAIIGYYDMLPVSRFWQFAESIISTDELDF